LLPASARVVYTQDAIADAVARTASEISDHFRGSSIPVLMGLLKGCFVFLADLARAVDIPVEVDFMVASSYGRSFRSSGDVQILYDSTAPLRGRNVVIVEDIIDTGRTLSRLIPVVQAREPQSLEVCTFLHKRLPAAAMVDARWVCLNAPDEFLVGYGLDLAEEYRQLPFIASLGSFPG